jgi:Tfp pilus assembly protein PilO
MRPIPRPRHRHYQRYFSKIKNFYSQKKVQVYSQIILSLFTVSFFTFFAIRPTLVTIAKLIKDVEDKKIVVNKLDQKIQALNLAQAEYHLISDKIYLLNQALPANADLAQLIRQVETLAQRDQVKIKSTNFEAAVLKDNTAGTKSTATAKKDKLKEISFNLVVAGDYPSLKKFFDDLAQLRRLVFISPFQYHAKEINKTDIVSLTLKAKAYFLSPV